MKFARDHRGERLLSMDITAMIDLVFLLIIFFMATAQFAKMTRAQLDLPREKGEDETQRRAPALVVNVLADGSYVVGGETVSPVALRSMLGAEVEKAGAASVRVLLRADRRARAARVNRVAEELARLGVRSWRLATSPDGGG